MNTKGVDGKISSELEALFQYINGGSDSIGEETDSELVKLIDSYVERTNNDDEWRDLYMKYAFDLEDQYDEGFKEGKAEAQASAKAKEAQTVKSMYADNIPVSKIVKYVSLSADEVMSIVSEKS